MAQAGKSQLSEITSTVGQMTTVKDRKILIVDEARFSRICAAILELDGFKTASITESRFGDQTLRGDHFGLVITSYPFGAFLFDQLKSMDTPVIVMSDHLGRDVMRVLGGFNDSWCMIKPVDYRELLTAVRRIMRAEDAGGKTHVA